MIRALILLTLLLPCASSAAELYAGHSTRGMSPATGDEIVGVLVGDDVKAGLGKFGSTHYAHSFCQAQHGPVFVGLGYGLVDGHPSLDGHGQFTLTAGVRIDKLVLRWLHFSNGADVFERGNKEARARNLGMDFITLGIAF